MTSPRGPINLRLELHFRIVKDTTHGQNHKTSLDFDCLVRWGLHNSTAMEYLKQNNVNQLNCRVILRMGTCIYAIFKVIHGDLALRNVLVTADLVAKLGNFGVSQNLKDDAYAICVKLPANDPFDSISWKWMAVESLTDHIFTYKSEILSFGVVLWEIFNLGLTPFPGVKY